MIVIKNIKKCFEINIYKKDYFELLIEFWLFATADACDAYHTKIYVRAINIKYQQFSISFKKKHLKKLFAPKVVINVIQTVLWNASAHWKSGQM